MREKLIATMAAQIAPSPDGISLPVKLERFERRRKLRAFTLVLQLLRLVPIAFVLPIDKMMSNAAYNDSLLTLMPPTTAALSSWEGKDLPDENVYVALTEQLAQALAQKTASVIGRRINPGTGG